MSICSICLFLLLKFLSFHLCISLIVHFFQLTLVAENKGENGRYGREKIGRAVRLTDCVRGGFCLINCFSGAGVCQFLWLSPAPRSADCMARAGGLISPPCAVLCLLAGREISFGNSYFSDLSVSFPECFGALLYPQAIVLTNSAFGLTRVQLPWCLSYFTEHTVKISHQGMMAKITSGALGYTWVKWNDPLISSGINPRQPVWFITNGTFILCAHQGLCWGEFGGGIAIIVIQMNVSFEVFIEYMLIFWNLSPLVYF